MIKFVSGILMLVFSLAVYDAEAEEIHVAAKNGDLETVERLLNEGMPVDLPSTSDTSSAGVSPLFVATKWGKLDVVQVLLEAGADPEYSSDEHYENTPFLLAIKYGRKEIVELFVALGVNVNLQTISGTPLSTARTFRRPEMADVLIENGADLSIRQPPISHLLASADIARGKRLANTCRICHGRFEPQNDGEAKVPSLWNIVGREKASQDNVKYSSALREFGGNWTNEDLNSFIASAPAFVPGTDMPALPNFTLRDRADMIAFLRTQSDDPAPLP
jgi:cytochrome c